MRCFWHYLTEMSHIFFMFRLVPAPSPVTVEARMRSCIISMYIWLQLTAYSADIQIDCGSPEPNFILKYASAGPDLQRQTAVTAYFSSEQLPLFVFARQRWSLEIWR